MTTLALPVSTTRKLTASGRPVRAGGEKRGNARNRRARKLWMLATFGDGASCPCAHCGVTLTYATVEADRIIPGGTYARHNIQPADRACNLARSNKIEWTRS
jgi:hypothetical protein